MYKIFVGIPIQDFSLAKLSSRVSQVPIRMRAHKGLRDIDSR
jgi:hypothetical protein